MFHIILYERGVFVMKKDIMNTIKEVEILFSGKDLAGLKMKFNNEEAFIVATLIRLLDREERCIGFSLLSIENAQSVWNHLDLQTRLDLLQNSSFENGRLIFDSNEGTHKNQIGYQIQVDVA